MLLIARLVRMSGLVSHNWHWIIMSLFSVIYFYDKFNVTINGIYLGDMLIALVTLITYGVSMAVSYYGFMKKEIKISDRLEKDVIYNHVVYVVSILAYAIYDIAGYVCLVIAFIYSIIIWNNRRGESTQYENS